MSGFQRRDVPMNRHPRQVYYGTVGKTRRSLAFKLPIADEDDRVVLVGVDPEHVAAKGLRSWMAAHRGWRIAPSQL